MESDADHLLLIARVMEAGSFSRAAEREHWPKSTVTRSNAALWEGLFQQLRDRVETAFMEAHGSTMAAPH